MGVGEGHDYSAVDGWCGRGQTRGASSISCERQWSSYSVLGLVHLLGRGASTVMTC